MASVRALTPELLGVVLEFLPKTALGRLAAVGTWGRKTLSLCPGVAARLPCPHRPVVALPLATAELLGIPDHRSYWEMNLLALTADQSRLFQAKLGRLYMYRLPAGPTLKPAEEVLVDPHGSINQIAVGFLGDTEVVVAVLHQHQVLVLRAHDLSSPPLLTFLNWDSTWSISCHPKTGRLAVGSNAHEILTFKLHRRGLQLSGPKLRGHQHNIPSVAFSPCGRYLASTSVDGTVRLWDPETAAQFLLRPCPGTSRQTGLALDAHWGWAIAWVSREAIPVVHPPPPSAPGLPFRAHVASLQAAIVDGLEQLRHALRQQQAPLSSLPPAAQLLLGSHFLLLATTHRLYLLRAAPHGTEPLAMVDVRDALPPAARHARPSRLAFMEVLPELAAVVTSTQGSGIVAVYQLVQLRAGPFQFVLQHTITPLRVGHPASAGLSGLRCVRDCPPPRRGSSSPPNPVSYTLYITDVDMNLFCYRLSHSGALPPHSPIDPAPPAPNTVGDPRPRLIDLTAAFARQRSMEVDDEDGSDSDVLGGDGEDGTDSIDLEDDLFLDDSDAGAHDDEWGGDSDEDLDEDYHDIFHVPPEF